MPYLHYLCLFVYGVTCVAVFSGLSIFDFPFGIL